MWQCASHVSAGALNAGARGAGSGPGISGTMVKAASRHAVLHRNGAIVRGTPRVHEADARVLAGKQMWELKRCWTAVLLLASETCSSAHQVRDAERDDDADHNERWRAHILSPQVIGPVSNRATVRGWSERFIARRHLLDDDRSRVCRDNPDPGRGPNGGHVRTDRDFRPNNPRRTSVRRSARRSTEHPGMAAGSSNRHATCNAV